MNGEDISDEEFKREVKVLLMKVYRTAFRRGFFSCLVGVLLFYVLFI